MKLVALVAGLVQLAIALAQIEPRQKYTMSFTYQAGSVAAYPPGTTIIYSAGAKVDYVAGASVTYLYKTTIRFPYETQVYTQDKTVTVGFGEDVTFNAGSQVAYGPGTSVQYATNGETRYNQFNGNTHAIAAYPEQTSVKFYYGPNGSNLILFPPGTIPQKYYNPGGSTQFGPSALPVEKDPQVVASARTYGYGYGGGSGYSYCSGYSNNGWPQTNYYNRNTGYQSTCRQTCYNCYAYTCSGGGGGGGGGMYGK